MLLRQRHTQRRSGEKNRLPNSMFEGEAYIVDEISDKLTTGLAEYGEA